MQNWGSVWLRNINVTTSLSTWVCFFCVAASIASFCFVVTILNVTSVWTNQTYRDLKDRQLLLDYRGKVERGSAEERKINELLNNQVRKRGGGVICTMWLDWLNTFHLLFSANQVEKLKPLKPETFILKRRQLMVFAHHGNRTANQLSPLWSAQRAELANRNTSPRIPSVKYFSVLINMSKNE